MSDREDKGQISNFEGPPATSIEIKPGQAIMNARAPEEREFIVKCGRTYFSSFLINKETGQLAFTTPGLVLLYLDFAWGCELSGLKILRANMPPIVINHSDSAENLRQYFMTRDAPDQEIEIACPEFAENFLKKLPGTEWRLIRIDTAAMMFSESKARVKNCAFDLWLEACLRGTASIFVIRRPATNRDRAHRIHHRDVIGGDAVTDGMVRFHRDGHGRPFIGEALAQNNKSLKPALQEALQRSFGWAAN